MSHYFHKEYKMVNLRTTVFKDTLYKIVQFVQQKEYDFMNFREQTTILTLAYLKKSSLSTNIILRSGSLYLFEYNLIKRVCFSRVRDILIY